MAASALFEMGRASDIERRHIWKVATGGGTPTRISTGDGIGRSCVLNVTAKTCRVPESFDWTNHEAPAPMWHSTQPMREWGDPL